MPNDRLRSQAASKMDGPTLIHTATSQASAAGGLTPYAFVSCFGAKAVHFLVRTAAGVPNIGTGTVIDVAPGGGAAIATGVSSGNYDTSFLAGTAGTLHVVPGEITTLYGATNQRIWVEAIRPRVQLAISATGVSCWAVVQWD